MIVAMDINRNNYETFFLLYLDRELNPAEMQEVDKFLTENTDLQKEFALLQQTIFLPTEVVFDQKESLLREEEKRRILPLYRMRIAAAVALLILGGWLITLQTIKNHAGGIAGNNQPANVKKNPTKEGSAMSSRSTDLKKGEGNNNQSAARKNLSAPQNRPAKIFVSSAVGIRNNNKVVQNTASNPDQLNTVSNGVSDEPLAATRKSSSLELQSSEVRAGTDPKQIATIAGTRAPVLLLASANSTDQFKYENADIKEPGYQMENAISVVALNDRNKGITGFFKKLTRRTPADE